SSTTTGTSARPNLRAASRRPWPAMIPSIESTRIGLVKPNSKMDAAICAICSAECVRAFLAYGTKRSVGQISMRRAIAGVIVPGSVVIGFEQLQEVQRWTFGLARAEIGHPFAPRCPVSRRLARGWPVGPPAALGRALAATDR